MIMARCPGCPAVEAAPGLLCWCRHAVARNVCKKAAEDPRYAAKVVERTLALGLDEAEALRRPPRQHRAVIRSFANSYSGAGRHIEYYGRALEMAGVPVAFDETGRDEVERPISDWLRSHVEPAPADPWRLQINYNGVAIDPSKATVYATMHESTRLKPGWVVELNKCEGVVVPTTWQVESYAASGVTVPIRVVPLGCDPAEGWRHGPGLGASRTEGTFRALFAAMLMGGGCRKGHGDAMRAFVRAFPREEYPDCELVIKITARCRPLLGEVPDDPRIRVIDRYLPTDELVSLYHSSTVLLAPTYGEGYGLHFAEAMACGVPPIAVFQTGAADLMDETCAYPLGFRWETARLHYEGQGEWHVPRHETIVSQLRRAYRDRAECAAKGEAAARRAASFDWWEAGRALREALVEFGMLADGSPSQAGPAPATQVAVQGREARRMAERLELVRGCDYRGGNVVDCGCDRLFHCGMGKGLPMSPNAVSFGDCLRCVASSDVHEENA